MTEKYKGSELGEKIFEVVIDKKQPLTLESFKQSAPGAATSAAISTLAGGERTRVSITAGALKVVLAVGRQASTVTIDGHSTVMAGDLPELFAFIEERLAGDPAEQAEETGDEENELPDSGAEHLGEVASTAVVLDSLGGPPPPPSE